jgi:D-alanyl-D-alanine carboxypeptidase
MKGWLVGLALGAVVVATGLGLWATWDSTQTTAETMPVGTVDRLVTTTSGARPTTTLPPPPACQIDDQPVTSDPAAEWATTLVDTALALPPAFVPPGLVEVSEAGFDSRDQVRTEVIADLGAMRAAAEANGTPIVVVSGYRSFDYQRNLYDNDVRELGEPEARRTTARPGHSEHQLGTAVDVLEPEAGELTPAFGQTPAGRWVVDHAHEYGFVQSYPEGAGDRTCYEYEPWHLRYVGREHAAAVHESGLTLREWLAARADDAG